MIENQQLFKLIPKAIHQWNHQDVDLWFKLNHIQINLTRKLIGSTFLQLTSNKLLHQFNISSFLSRKVSDWIQFQAPDYQQYVSEMQNKIKNLKLKKNQQQNSLKRMSSFPEIKLNNFLQENKQYYQQRIDPPKDGNKIKNENKLSSDINQLYKPLKYQVIKNNTKNKKLKVQDSSTTRQQKDKNLQKVNKKVNKKKLMLESLRQNIQNNQQIQTCKYIEQQKAAILQSQQISKNPASSEHSQHNSSNYYVNNVKFVSSRLTFNNPQPVLNAYFQGQVYQITKNVKIGRSTYCDIILKSDAISRKHLQIVVQDSHANDLSKRTFYLRDLQSRYGTYIQVDPQRPKLVQQNCIYYVSKIPIRVNKFKISKNSLKFDLNITLLYEIQQQKSFIDRKAVTMGKKRNHPNVSKQIKHNQITKRTKSQEPTKCDIQSEDSQMQNNHCKFTLIDGQLYLEQVQGNFMEKLQPNKMFQLKGRNSFNVKLGDQHGVGYFYLSNPLKTMISYLDQQ